MQIPFTRGMELTDWENAVSYQLGSYMPVPTMPSDDWQQWGLFFFNYPLLTPLDPPNPFAFDDWHQWGDRLVDALSDADGLLSGGNGGSGGGGPTSRFIITQTGINIETQDGRFLATQ